MATKATSYGFGLIRQVTNRMVLQKLKEFELEMYYETSAKTGFNAKEVFKKAAILLHENMMEYRKLNRSSLQSYSTRNSLRRLSKISQKGEKSDCTCA